MPSRVKTAVRRSRAVVEAALAAGGSVYGVNTGFGKLANVSIEPAQLGTLQRNLLLSHATGVGEPLPVPVAQLAFALRIHNLARGFSGVRPELLETMIALFNAGYVPVIPCQGSVGASGDLAPLAHMALPLLGRGELHDGHGGRRIRPRTALRKLGLRPVELAAKEGLALINGTQIMTALGLLAVERSRVLNLAADIGCAMTIEALRGSQRPFVAGVHRLRNHPGQGRTAANLRGLLRGSQVMKSHAGCDKVQDAYSMRCAPQVHGAAKDAWRFAERVLVTEASSVTDNPLVFPDGAVVSAGNFHGQPVSQALDFLAIAVSTLANISERRIENLVNPASVDTIPTSANREDHVSMGVTAARHAFQVVENSEKVLAIELMSAAQGLDCGDPDLRPGRGVAAAYDCIRRRVPPLRTDRFLAPDIAAVEELVGSGELVAAVMAVRGIRLGL
jgi:histidine ammonia-lyase